MSAMPKKINNMSHQLMKHLAALEAQGGPPSPQTLAQAMGHDLAASINDQVKFLIANGYIKKTGKAGTCHVRLSIIKELP